jgi:RimJ/RimL family protein N-acetyltransferase
MPVANETAPGHHSLSLRMASDSDGAWLRSLRNDPEVRAASRSTAEVAIEEHARWLARVLADPDRQLLVGEIAGTPIGQVRFDRLEDERFEISIAIKAEFRGSGLSTRLIEMAVARLRDSFPGVTVEAYVRSENSRSLAAFEAAGFRRTLPAARDDFVALVESVQRSE